MARLTLDQRIIGRTRVAVAAAGSRLEGLLRNAAPVDEGTLRDRTYVRPDGPNRLRISVEVDYASYVREGFSSFTQPKKTGGVYAFMVDRLTTLRSGREVSGLVFTPGPITHPGYEGNSWYDESVDQLPLYIRQELASSGL